MYCPKCGSPIPEGAKFCTDCGARLSPAQQVAPAQSEYQVKTPELSMKWFKFLIYFSLWAGAILNLGTGFSYITGIEYESAGISADVIYAYYGNALKSLDIFYGIVLAALAVFFLYTRFRLAKFKENGPACLQLAYLMSVIVSIVYMIGVYFTTGINSLSTESISTLVTSCAMIAFNVSYFKKRSHLFVN